MVHPRKRYLFDYLSYCIPRCTSYSVDVHLGIDAPLLWNITKSDK